MVIAGRIGRSVRRLSLFDVMRLIDRCIGVLYLSVVIPDVSVVIPDVNWSVYSIVVSIRDREVDCWSVVCTCNDDEGGGGVGDLISIAS